ncbi:MAG: serine/threonine protein kinase [Spartobacteria bacterium]|nr:serine/threonine protein kinase [Spartobacteria bacterium]
MNVTQGYILPQQHLTGMTMAVLDISAERVEKIACRKCGRHLDVSGLEPFSTVKCPDCGTTQTVPMQFGNFLLLELLGKGGMGAVYRALDQSLGRYVGIKVMQKKYGEDKQFVENFFREARAAAALNHPNVVQIYSCGEELGQPYIIMELVGGGRFDEMIADGNPIEEVRALEIAVDVAEGLKAANEIGLIHGDIKPANILFDRQDSAKVVDFGLARFVNWQPEGAGEIWGTPYYIAPEKAKGQRVDHRSDIYSLGATLYHALGAKPPFDGKTATDVVLARLQNPAIGLRVIRPSLQPETADLIARMLEADPFMRYPTYASLLADVREALRVAKQEQRASHHKVHKSKLAPFIVMGIIVLVGLVLFVGAWQASKHHKATLEQQAKQAVVPDRPGTPVAEDMPEDSTLTTDEVKTIAPVVQPFTKNGSKILMLAAGNLAQGKTMAAEEELQVLYEHTRPANMGRYWVRLFQAVGCWSEGRTQDARIYMREIMDAPFGVMDHEHPHPGAYLQAVVSHMTGESDEGVLYLEASKWPVWYRDLAEFFVGLKHFQDGRVSLSERCFSNYINKEPQEAVWPYSLRHMARNWVNQQEEWERLLGSLGGEMDAGRSRDALMALEEFRGTATVLLAPMIDARKQRIEVLLQQQEEQARREEAIAHQRNVQMDLDQLDDIRTANQEFINDTDYRKAAVAVAKLIPKMQTDEGKDSLRMLQDSYERLNDLKRFLIDSIDKSPYPGGRDLGGTVVKANSSTLKIALQHGHGELMKKWDEIGLRSTVLMAAHYIDTSSLTDAEKADEMLSLALLCYFNGAFRPAAKYAQDAANLHPEIKTVVRRFMPDIIED